MIQRPVERRALWHTQAQRWHCFFLELQQMHYDKLVQVLSIEEWMIMTLWMPESIELLKAEILRDVLPSYKWMNRILAWRHDETFQSSSQGKALSSAASLLHLCVSLHKVSHLCDWVLTMFQANLRQLLAAFRACNGTILESEDEKKLRCYLSLLEAQ